MDPRVRKLAKLMINYSLKLKKGQLLLIKGEIAAQPLIEAAFEEALKVGANPYTEIIVPGTIEALLKQGSPAQIGYVHPMKKLEINKIDALLSIWAAENLNFLSGVDPKRQAIQSKARGPLMKKFFKREAEGVV